MESRKKRKVLERKLITYHEPRSPISEQYRTIRTNIEFSNVGKGYKTIIVTSANPGEGKSTTVANLAIVFAQQGKKVLLIDADLRKPTIHYTFQLSNTIGLTNVLTKKATLIEGVQSTIVNNLFVLTCGPIPPNPAELLGSSAMSSVMKFYSNQFDVVLLDTPPLLAVTDATILANLCDASILIVSSGKTEIESAKRAKELLINSSGKLLGAVLNNKRKKDSQYYYYYGQHTSEK